MKEMKKKSGILGITKNGGASVFVVILTVMVLSIITMSFSRLIISEATKTTNTDLSQSAYDSALAGIEDAKTALLKYHSCLDKGYSTGYANGDECQRTIYNMQNGMSNIDCSIVQKTLGRERADDNSVIIQETQNSSDVGNNASMLQAYTCVTIQEDLEDYRTTLNSDSRIRIIPIRSDQIDALSRIKIQWFSSANFAAVGGQSRYCKDFWSIGCENGHKVPSVITARLIQTDEWFNLSELSVSNSANYTDTGTLVFNPSLSSGSNHLFASAWGESANKGENKTVEVACNQRSDWLCSVDIELPKTFNGGTNRNDANTYLLVTLPYGVPETDISVTAYTDSQRVDFSGVQARIDSTGRANDLFRRVETRVELVDTYFAYPEFEITMTPFGNGLIDKTFWATFDCWYTNNGNQIDDYEEIMLDDYIINEISDNRSSGNVTTCYNNYDYGGSSEF